MKRQIAANGQIIEYEFNRGKRKTITVKVLSDGSVSVYAPKWISLHRVEEFLLEKFDWISKKSEESRVKNMLSEKSYSEGSIIHSIGKDFLIAIKTGKRCNVRQNGNYVIVTVQNESEDKVRELLVKWNYSRLNDYIHERIDYFLPILTHYSELMDVPILKITRISVKTVKTRWGSCSAKGSLNFNGKLSTAPLPIIDYVIVHELCHLMYMNHSADFWGAVAYVIPDYSLRRRMLKNDGWKYNM